MRHRRLGVAALAVLGAALPLGGCNNSDPVAPKDSSIILSASPTTLPSTGGASDITAVVIDANGIPQNGVAVFFSTNAGSLASQGIAQRTDGNGRAFDTLTTADSAQITAQSGGASAQVSVTVGGQRLVGEVVLTCNPTSGNAPLQTTCNVHVADTNFQDLEGQFVSIELSDPNADVVGGALSFETDVNGNATLMITNLTLDGSTITANAAGKFDVVTIMITPTP